MLHSIVIIIISVSLSIISGIFMFQPRGFISEDAWRLSLIEDEVRKIKSEVGIEPTDSRFVVVTSMTGRYAVSVKNVKQYASGAKMTFEVINMYSVGLTDVKINVLAIPLSDDGKEYIDKRKRITETIGEIPAGTAKRKTVSIPGIMPEKLRTVYVSITEGGLRHK